jgi:adenylate cyclase
VSEELGVQYVLEGSIQQSESRLRITAQLINATGAHRLFSERYDRELKDIFATQDEITIAVVRAVRVNVTSREQARIERRGRSPAAAAVTPFFSIAPPLPRLPLYLVRET